jgi:hypothetical protein
MTTPSIRSPGPSHDLFFKSRKPQDLARDHHNKRYGISLLPRRNQPQPKLPGEERSVPHVVEGPSRKRGRTREAERWERYDIPHVDTVASHASHSYVDDTVKSKASSQPFYITKTISKDYKEDSRKTARTLLCALETRHCTKKRKLDRLVDENGEAEQHGIPTYLSHLTPRVQQPVHMAQQQHQQHQPMVNPQAMATFQHQQRMLGQQRALERRSQRQQEILGGQSLRTKLLDYFQRNPQHAGWQATMQPIERVGMVSEL